MNRGLVRNSSPGLFCITPRTLEKGGELLKYNLYIFSIIRWLSTFQFFLRELFFLFNPVWSDLFIGSVNILYYSKYYPLFNWYPVIKVIFSESYYLAWLYYSITLCDLINFEIVSHEIIFYLTVKSYETPFKKKNQDRNAFLSASYTPPPPMY